MTAPRALRLPPVSEALFTQQVLQLASALNWRSAHFRPAMTSQGWRTPVQGDGKGFFDLVLIRTPRVIFAELKSERGKLSPEQVEWMESVAGCPTENYTWKPNQLDDVARILK